MVEMNMGGQNARDLPVIISAKRTAIGSAGKLFANIPVDVLAAAVIGSVADTVMNVGLTIDDVILGNCLGPGGNIARVSALRAGLPITTPAVTVDRQCGSGLDAIMQAAARVRSGQAELIIAGGAESASTAPHRFWPPDGDSPAERYERAPFAPIGMSDPEMGPAADQVAERFSISRERQDRWAARSHERAAAAREDGRFEAEIVEIAGVSHERQSDYRPTATFVGDRGLKTLARFEPAFNGSGTVTAGNSCGISDGAAAMAVTTEAVRAKLGISGLRILGSAITAGDPALPGIGAAAAILKVLEECGVLAKELSFVEITEAFAAQVLAVSDLAGLDEATISVDGGAIALGHPWGASGAILVVRLSRLIEAKAHGVGSQERIFGLAACSIGGGQGIAMLLEHIPADHNSNLKNSGAKYADG